MSNFLDKLAAVAFYASILLVIPFIFSLIIGDGGWIPIGITITILALPAVPQMIIGVAKNIYNFIMSILNPDTPFNYAKIVNMDMMRKKVEILTLGEVLAITSLAWIIVPVISMIPYLWYGIAPLDAFFESASGWTSTGLTALETVTVLPQSIILFRSITQWIGGLGIIILILSTFRGKEAISFLKAEGRQSMELGIGKTVEVTFKVYIVLTILGILFLMASGFDVFNAVNLAFSGLSNGGFFPFDSYDLSALQKMVLAMLMFAGATSFLFYRSIWHGAIDRALLDEEFVLYVFVIILAVIMIIAIGKEDIFNSILNGISAIATGGFGIGDLGILHTFAMYVLILMMLCGGMVGSTTGGIKLWRILVILKAMVIQVKETFLPHGTVQRVKINNLPINDSMIVESATFVFAYLFLFLFSAGILLTANYTLQNSLFMVASAMGNVGLATLNVPILGVGSKILLIGLMYLGRIEIFPCLALIGYLMRR
ncbi:MAG: potassium transporter TrkG [Candidatus Micrarchaeota archaeon]